MLKLKCEVIEWAEMLSLELRPGKEPVWFPFNGNKQFPNRWLIYKEMVKYIEKKYPQEDAWEVLLRSLPRPFNRHASMLLNKYLEKKLAKEPFEPGVRTYKP